MVGPEWVPVYLRAWLRMSARGALLMVWAAARVGAALGVVRRSTAVQVRQRFDGLARAENDRDG
jgi:hypothetical protein